MLWGVCCICLLPIVACFIASAAPPPRPSASQRTPLMTQPRQSAPESESSSAGGATTRHAESSSSTGLFPPSSKFHPDRQGVARRRRWLVVDFDGTCTAQDTTPLLPTLAARAAASQRRRTPTAGGAGAGEEGASEAHDADLQRRLSRFRQLESEYLRRYGEAKAALLPPADRRPSAGEDGGGEEPTLDQVLDGLDEPSILVTQLVSESGVLRGLGFLSASELEGMLQLKGVSMAAVPDGATADELVFSRKEAESMGEDSSETKVLVGLRDGCESALVRALSGHGDENAERCGEPPPPPGWNLAVLSINWCPALIEAALVRPVLRKRRRDLRPDSRETEIPVWSNGVDGDGVVSLRVPGSRAKRDRIAELRRHVRRGGDGGQIIYVGDSATDLAALLEADVGIVMGSSSTLTAIAERYGIGIRRRQRGDCGKRNACGIYGGPHNAANCRPRELLWQVDSWQEVEEILIELAAC